MVTYELRVKPSVAKDLKGLPRTDIQRILGKIEGLRLTPRPAGVEKLSGEEKYRIRQWDYRILYTIDDRLVVVEVVKVGHRKDVYRK